MAKQEIKYEEAVAQLEAIVRRMETGELDLDSLAEELKKAQKLIKMCKDKLTQTDEEIKKRSRLQRCGHRLSHLSTAFMLHKPSPKPLKTYVVRNIINTHNIGFRTCIINKRTLRKHLLRNDK